MTDHPAPRPWCGNRAIIFRNPGRSVVFVRCNGQDCGAQGPEASTREMAIAAWNRLATAKPPCDAELAALEAAARAATPGEWFPRYGGRAAACIFGRDDFLIAETSGRNRDANASFIAKAHPDATLRLIQRVREAEADAARFRWLDDTASYYGLGDDLRIEWRGSGSSVRAAIDQEIAALETAVREAMGHD